MSFTPEEIAIIEKAFDDAIAKSPTLQIHLEGALRDIRGKTEQTEQEPLMITPGGGAFPFVEVGGPDQVGFLIDGIVHLDDDYETGVWPLYTAPVRTKDLTDDEIAALFQFDDYDFARAVIAADRKKNK